MVTASRMEFSISIEGLITFGRDLRFKDVIRDRGPSFEIGGHDSIIFRLMNAENRVSF